MYNQRNVEAVRAQIDRKLKSKPYYANEMSVTETVTDIDHFPYTRFFRGVAPYPDPIIFEREAGWRLRRDNCYRLSKHVSDTPKPNNCWETACSTVYPCYPQNVLKFSDRDALNVMLNNASTIQYR